MDESKSPENPSNDLSKEIPNEEVSKNLIIIILIIIYSNSQRNYYQ